MNTLDKKYTDLLQDILDNGHIKKDRTGTGTISVFGREIRHKMSEGFPVLTTKRIHFESVKSELLWFLQGRTDLRYLLEHNNYIWVGDAHKAYINHFSNDGLEPTKEARDKFIERIKTDDKFAKRFGELGPIYGKQWRSWEGIDKNNFVNTDNIVDPLLGNRGVFYKTEPIDQIANLINELKTNPDSRRLMVSAWNPSDLEDQVLPPCHYAFQCYTRELTIKEKVELLEKKGKSIKLVNTEFEKFHIPTRAISLKFNMRSSDCFLGLPFNIASYGLLLEIIAKEVNMVPDELIGSLGDCHLYLNHIDQAKEQISRGKKELSIEERFDLMFKDPKFDPLEVGIGERNEKDKANHLKFDHLLCDSYEVPRVIQEYFDLPKLKWMSHLESFESLINDPTHGVVLRPKDFGLENYQSHPKIEAPLSN